jgi:carbon monoxide dehydrogenase subunit G
MELDHEFTVAAPVDEAWDVLVDLDRVVPCMPGAALTSYDGDAFEGTVKVKLGPVSMTFTGKGRFVERDADSRTMVVEASGKDARGGGTAKATVRAALRAAGADATEVKVHTDLAVTGRVAQFGRGMIADVSGRLLGQFTDCLQGRLAAGPAADAPAEAPATAASLGSPGAAAPAPAAAGATGATTATQTATPAPSAGPSPRPTATATRAAAEVEPVDLLAVTGVSGAARRSLPYVVIFVVGAVVGGILVRWLS